jgi:cupin 2 domain-containing protein
MRLQNLFENLPLAWPDEVYSLLLQQPGLRIERIVSQGQTSPEGFWYDQPEDEVVFLLQGAAQLQLAGEAVIALKPGDGLWIPAHRLHRVVWTDPTQATVWLALFSPPTPPSAAAGTEG